jgi:hypothetical protein
LTHFARAPKVKGVKRKTDLSLSLKWVLHEGRALYNAPSADYRALIEAWAAYAGPAQPKPLKTLASHEYLMRIDDPAIRSIMQSVIAERDRLKAQLNVLKANTQVTVHRRPLGATVSAAPGIQPVAVLALPAQLTSSEREALQKAVSAGYLEERGLKEGSHGEIVNERGRVVFEVGSEAANQCATALRELPNKAQCFPDS